MNRQTPQKMAQERRDNSNRRKIWHTSDQNTIRKIKNKRTNLLRKANKEETRKSLQVNGQRRFWHMIKPVVKPIKALDTDGHVVDSTRVVVAEQTKMFCPEEDKYKTQ